MRLMTTILFATVASAMALAEPLYKGTMIFPKQEKHVHGSSIVECRNGDLLACWFHGSGERGANDVQVQGARMKKGAKAWSPVFVMADTPDFPDCNPVLFIDKEGRLWLFWVPVIANRWEHCLLKYRRAEHYTSEGPPTWSWQDVILFDPGETFPDAIKKGFEQIGFEQEYWGEYAQPYDKLLVEAAKDPAKRQQGWMTRIHPYVLPSGRILLPLYSDGFNLALVAISDDRGETWRASKPIVGLGPTQPSIVLRKDGVLAAFLRDEGGPPARIQISTSSDSGETWSASKDTDIPNPSASIEVIALADGKWLLVHNDTEDGRHSLAVSVSEDEGKTWKWKRHLERTDKDKGSFAYPSVIQGRNGLVHATYSYRDAGGASIKHVTFNTEWVQQGD